MSERIERDFQGHFIGKCTWFKTTDVGGHRVSTVGEYRPLLPTPRRQRGDFEEIGYGRLYETMVFPLGAETCDCGCGAPTVCDWSERDFEAYNDRAAAEAGHERMVAIWASGSRAPGADGGRERE